MFRVEFIGKSMYCDSENNLFGILQNLHVFSAPENEKVVFGMLSVCMYVRMCTSLALEPFHIRY
jgi:hypothetical protein